MTYQQFFLGLLIAVVLAVGGVFGFYSTLDIQYAMPVIIGLGVMLALICVVMFWLGKRTAGAENKHLFGNVFIGMTGVKMLLCAGILFAYIIYGGPKDSLFILPVFFVYIVFTALEVVSLLKLSGEAK